MSIHFLPIAGKPLEYESPETSQSVFTPMPSGFLVGRENRLLETAVLWILNRKESMLSARSRQRQPVETPFSNIPPDGPGLFHFHGTSGTGKTHLLRGILEIWKQGRRRVRAYYLRGIDFARELADAVGTHTTEDLQDRYRRAELLAIDDLDELIGKKAAQEELRHTLDAVLQGGGVALLAGKRGMNAYSDFEDSLIARLQEGLTLPLRLPGPEVRSYFLREVAASFRVTIPESLLRRFVTAQSVTLPILYGRFAQLYFDVHAAGRPLGEAELSHYLKDREKSPQTLFEDIVRATAGYFRLKPSQLKGRNRRTTLSGPRSLAIYLARELTGASFQEIGDYFGRRDHKTISYYCTAVEAKMGHDPEIRRHLQAIEEGLNEGG